MAYIENIVIGTPIVEPCLMFAKDETDWKRVEQEKTYFTMNARKAHSFRCEMDSVKNK